MPPFAAFLSAARPSSSAARRWTAVLRWALLVVLVSSLVLVPWWIWGSAMEGWVLEFMVRPTPPPFAALWIVGLLAADVFLPIPSSIVAVAAGVFLGFGLGSVTAWLGLTIGCLVGYAFGRRWGPATARKIVGEASWQRAEQWARRSGVGLVLCARPVPVLAEASTFYLGASRLAFGRYFLACSIGNAVIAVVYASVGSFSVSSGALEPALMAGFVLPGLAMLMVRLWGRRRASRT